MSNQTKETQAPLMASLLDNLKENLRALEEKSEMIKYRTAIIDGQHEEPTIEDSTKSKQPSGLYEELQVVNSRLTGLNIIFAEIESRLITQLG